MELDCSGPIGLVCAQYGLTRRFAMITEAKINNFKCFKELTVPELGRITLIGGRNNVGKTTLLEALFVYLDRINPRMIIRLFGWRGIPEVLLQPETVWGPVFYDQDMSQEIQISVKSDSERGVAKFTFNKQYFPPQATGVIPPEQASVKTEDRTPRMEALDIDYIDRDGRVVQRSHLYTTPQGEPALNVDFASYRPRPAVCFPSRSHIAPIQTTDAFSQVAKMGKEEEIIDILQIIEPRLKNLKVITTGGIPLVQGKLDGLTNTLPVNLMGEGMEKILSLSTSIVSGGFHYILIDEIENGLHYSVMADIWKMIGKAARQYNCQIIATTHSDECLEAAHVALTDMREDFRYVRLDRQDGLITAKVADYEMIGSAIRARMEVR
jgi:predicted ATPase